MNSEIKPGISYAFGRNPIIDIDIKKIYSAAQDSHIPLAYLNFDNTPPPHDVFYITVGSFANGIATIYPAGLVQGTVRRIQDLRDQLLEIQSPPPPKKRWGERREYDTKYNENEDILEFVDLERMKQYVTSAQHAFSNFTGIQKQYTHQEAKERATRFLTNLAARHLTRRTALTLAHEHAHALPLPETHEHLRPHSEAWNIAREHYANQVARQTYRNFVPAVMINQEALYQHLFVRPLQAHR